MPAPLTATVATTSKTYHLKPAKIITNLSTSETINDKDTYTVFNEKGNIRASLNRFCGQITAQDFHTGKRHNVTGVPFDIKSLTKWVNENL